MQKTDKPIITEYDALIYASDRLNQMSSDCDMAELILKVIGGLPDNPMKEDEKFNELLRQFPNPKLQREIFRAASASVRELAVEKRLSATAIQAEAAIPTRAKLGEKG